VIFHEPLRICCGRRIESTGGEIRFVTLKWDEFRRETFGEPYLVWHEGADFDSLLRRWQEQPRLVSAMLRLGLSGADPGAAQATSDLSRSPRSTSVLAFTRRL